MPTVADIIAELRKLGSETTKRTLMRHGAREPFFGVKVADLKLIHKRVKTDHALALALYDTGIADAQYLAGYIADPARMTRAQLQKWVKTASWQMVGEYTVPWVAAESPVGAEVAREWIDAKTEAVAASGWATWSSLVAITPDDGLDLDELVGLLDRVQKRIQGSPNRVRYTMNGFVIAVGCHVPELTAKAKAVANAIGTVTVDMGDTACQVPAALDYIVKVEKAGRVGKKRKTAMC